MRFMVMVKVTKEWEAGVLPKPEEFAAMQKYNEELERGKRFFAEGPPPRAFALDSTKPFPSGIVVNTYKAAGPLQDLN